jgi:hypothetical protein
LPNSFSVTFRAERHGLVVNVEAQRPARLVARIVTAALGADQHTGFRHRSAELKAA